MERIGPMILLVDGYNVIRNVPALMAAERQGGLAGGREALRLWLAGRYRRTPHEVVVVYDGTGEAESAQPLARWARGHEVYTRRGESADDYIRRRTVEEQARGARVRTVSNDGEVRMGVERAGGEVTRVDELAEELNAPDRHTRKRYQHRSYVRAQFEADANPDSGDVGGRSRPRGKRRRQG